MTVDIPWAICNEWEWFMQKKSRDLSKDIKREREREKHAGPKKKKLIF